MGRARRRAGGPRLLGLVVLPLLLACGADEAADPLEGETISRERFVETYVALRRGALESEEGIITEERRERILAEHGVTGEDLLTFTEVHGRRVEFMRDVWSDVEARLLGEEANTSGADTIREPGADTTREPPGGDTAAAGTRAVSGSP